MERHIKVKVIYDAHESQDRKTHCFMPCCAKHRGPYRRRAMVVSSAKQVARREREDLWASAFIGSQAEKTAKEVRDFPWCVLMSLGQSEEGNEGNLWKRPALLYWCTWSPGRGPRACLWGCWGIRKIWGFKHLERRLLPKCVQFPSVSSEVLNFPAIDKIPLVTYLYI